MLLKISHIHDAHEPRYVVLEDDRVYIISGGRGDIVLADSTVANPHAKLTLSNGTIVVENLRGSHGTFVDEEPIGAEPTPVELAQWIRVGETLLQLTPGERIPAANPDEIREPTVDEAAFLTTLRANPADDETRLVYADWLEARGYPIGARYLRLELEGEIDYERSELVGRAITITDEAWRSIVSRGRIGGCVVPHCPRRWHRLERGDRSRSCATCKRTVRYCTTIDEVARCGQAHTLVVIDAALSRREAAHVFAHGHHGPGEYCDWDHAGGADALFRTVDGDDEIDTLDRELPDEPPLDNVNHAGDTDEMAAVDPAAMVDPIAAIVPTAAIVPATASPTAIDSEITDSTPTIEAADGRVETEATGDVTDKVTAAPDDE